MITANFLIKKTIGSNEKYGIQADDIDAATSQLARMLGAAKGHAKLEWSRREGDEQVTMYDVGLFDDKDLCMIQGCAVVRVPKLPATKTLKQIRLDLMNDAGFFNVDDLADVIQSTRQRIDPWLNGKRNNHLLQAYLYAKKELREMEAALTALRRSRS